MEFKDLRDFPLFPPKLTIAGLGDEVGGVPCTSGTFPTPTSASFDQNVNLLLGGKRRQPKSSEKGDVLSFRPGVGWALVMNRCSAVCLQQTGWGQTDIEPEQHETRK